MYLTLFTLSSVVARTTRWNLPAVKQYKDDHSQGVFVNQSGGWCRINGSGTKHLFRSGYTQLQIHQDCPSDLPGYESDKTYHGYKEYLAESLRDVVYEKAVEDDMIHVSYAGAFGKQAIRVPCECLLVFSPATDAMEDDIPVLIKRLDQLLKRYIPSLKAQVEGLSKLPEECVGDMGSRLKAEKKARLLNSYLTLEGKDNVYNYVEMNILNGLDRWDGTQSDLMMKAAKDMKALTQKCYFELAELVMQSCWMVDWKKKRAAAALVAQFDSKMAEIAKANPAGADKTAPEATQKLQQDKVAQVALIEASINSEMEELQRITLRNSNGSLKKIDAAHASVNAFVKKIISDMSDTTYRNGQLNRAAVNEWELRSNAAKDFIANSAPKLSNPKQVAIVLLDGFSKDAIAEGDFIERFDERAIQLLKAHDLYDEFCLKDGWSLFVEVFNKSNEKSKSKSWFRSEDPNDRIISIANTLKQGLIAAKEVNTCIGATGLPYPTELKGAADRIRHLEGKPQVSDLIRIFQWMHGVVHQSIIVSDAKVADQAKLAAAQAEAAYRRMNQALLEAKKGEEAEAGKRKLEAQEVARLAVRSAQEAATAGDKQRAADCNLMTAYVLTAEGFLGSIATMEEHDTESAKIAAQKAFPPLSRKTAVTELDDLVRRGASLTNARMSEDIISEIRSKVEAYCDRFPDVFTRSPADAAVPVGWVTVPEVLGAQKCPLAVNDRVMYLRNTAGVLWGKSGTTTVVSVSARENQFIVTLYGLTGNKEFDCKDIAVRVELSDEIKAAEASMSYELDLINLELSQAEQVCNADDLPQVSRVIDDVKRRFPAFYMTRMPLDSIREIAASGRVEIMKAISSTCAILHLEPLLRGVSYISDELINGFDQGIRKAMSDPVDILIGKMKECPGHDGLRGSFDNLSKVEEFKKFKDAVIKLKGDIPGVVRACTSTELQESEKASLLLEKGLKMIAGDCSISPSMKVKMFAGTTWESCTVQKVESSGDQLSMGQTSQSMVTCVGGKQVACSLIAVESSFQIAQFEKPHDKYAYVQKLAADVEKVCPANMQSHLRIKLKMASDAIKNDVSKSEDVYRTKSVLQRLELLTEIVTGCAISLPGIEGLAEAVRTGAKGELDRATEFLDVQVVKVLFRKTSKCVAEQPECSIPKGWASQPGVTCRITSDGSWSFFTKGKSKFFIHPECPLNLPGALKQGDVEGYTDFIGKTLGALDVDKADMVQVGEFNIPDAASARVPCECLLIEETEAASISKMDRLVNELLPSMRKRFAELKGLSVECIGDQEFREKAELVYRQVASILSIHDFKSIYVTPFALAMIERAVVILHREYATAVYQSCVNKEGDAMRFSELTPDEIDNSLRTLITESLDRRTPDEWARRSQAAAEFAKTTIASIEPTRIQVLGELKATLDFKAEHEDILMNFNANTQAVVDNFIKFDSCTNRASLADLEAQGFNQPSKSRFLAFFRSKSSKDLKWMLETLKVKIAAAKDLINCMKEENKDDYGNLPELDADIEAASNSFTVSAENEAVDGVFQLSMRAISATLSEAVKFTLEKRAKESIQVSKAALSRLKSSLAAANLAAERAAGGTEEVTDPEAIAKAKVIAQEEADLVASQAELVRATEAAVTTADEVIAASKVIKQATPVSCPDLRAALIAAEKKLGSATDATRAVEELAEKFAASSSERSHFLESAKKVKSKEAGKVLITEISKEVNKLCGADRKHVMMAGAGAGIGFLGGAIQAKLAGKSWSSAFKAGMKTAVAGGFAGGLGSWLKSKFGK